MIWIFCRESCLKGKNGRPRPTDKIHGHWRIPACSVRAGIFSSSTPCASKNHQSSVTPWIMQGGYPGGWRGARQGIALPVWYRVQYIRVAPSGNAPPPPSTLSNPAPTQSASVRGRHRKLLDKSQHGWFVLMQTLYLGGDCYNVSCQWNTRSPSQITMVTFKTESWIMASLSEGTWHSSPWFVSDIFYNRYQENAFIDLWPKSHNTCW